MQIQTSNTFVTSKKRILEIHLILHSENNSSSMLQIPRDLILSLKPRLTLLMCFPYQTKAFWLALEEMQDEMHFADPTTMAEMSDYV